MTLALRIVELDSMKLLKTLPDDDASLCYFETSAGEAFIGSQPAPTVEEETGIIEILHEILDEILDEEDRR